MQNYNNQNGFSISVILPVYNEEGNIGQVIEKSYNFLKKEKIIAQYEIIVVDDGSKDNTNKITQELLRDMPNLKLITHPKNFGYGATLISGLKVSRYPLIFFMDADGQFDIKEIHNMFVFLKDFDIITGYRRKRADNLYRIILGKIYGGLVFLLFRLRFKDINCGFKIFKKEVLDFEYENKSGGTFFTKVFLQARDKGYSIKEIPVEHMPRLKGRETGGSLRIAFMALFDLIRLRFKI
jgi:glycosyltransferase involved in cell wall biosynthesis